jgi:hypothetical protein
MWQTNTAWFDAAIVLGIFTIGSICFGRFEEHHPRWRRLVKVLIVLLLTQLLAFFGLRWATYTIIGAFGLMAAYMHLRWLPSHGINGWTGEPREKYLELVRSKGWR